VPSVAITIDTEFPDQPASDPVATCDRLLAILGAHDIAATFFVVGSWAGAYPEHVGKIASYGHLIGSHSYAHCRLERMTPEGIISDLDDCRRLMLHLGIETRPWFRPPYGEMGGKPESIHGAVQAAGYRSIAWHAHGRDWDSSRSVDDVVYETVTRVYQRWPQPAIVLFHSWSDHAPGALIGLIEALSSSQPDYITIDQLP
jgi:peptidoglycan-N-acetylglucosamine deacetylase